MKERGRVKGDVGGGKLVDGGGEGLGRRHQRGLGWRQWVRGLTV